MNQKRKRRYHEVFVVDHEIRQDKIRKMSQHIAESSHEQVRYCRCPWDGSTVPHSS
jgi:protein tyrosine phosphatase (PTP) superfamily phosphohydrolase (DUF442 family)